MITLDKAVIVFIFYRKRMTFQTFRYNGYFNVVSYLASWKTLNTDCTAAYGLFEASVGEVEGSQSA